MKSLQVSPLCSWIPFSQVAWRSYKFCWRWLPHACAIGRGSEYIVWVVGRQTLTASNKKFCQAFLLLSCVVRGLMTTHEEGRSWSYPYAKQMLLLCPEPSLIPALSQPLSALWELRCKTWEHDTHIGISPEP